MDSGARTPEPSTAPDFSTMSFDIVIVRVGEPSISIPIYKDVVCSVSPYFRGAFNRSFLEAEERAITLSDVSEATFRIFISWCYSQSLPIVAFRDSLVCPESTNNSLEATGGTVDPDHSGVQKNSTKRIFDEYFVGQSPYLQTMNIEDIDKKFHQNTRWTAQYEEVVKSLVQLYIFADKYSVDQLRDDTMSVYLGYCVAYSFYPDPEDVGVIELAYANLPAAATLSRYLVLSTTYFWTPTKLTLQSGKLERLHPRFTLDVMTAQAQRRQPPNQGETSVTKTVPHLASDGLRNSCVFHEHRLYNGSYCRWRLANAKFIFDGLLGACVKEADRVLSKSS